MNTPPAEELNDAEVIAQALAEVEGFSDLWHEDDAALAQIKEAATLLCPYVQGKPKRLQALMATSPLVKGYVDGDKGRATKARNTIAAAVDRVWAKIGAEGGSGPTGAAPGVVGGVYEPEPADGKAWAPDMSLPHVLSPYQALPDGGVNVTKASRMGPTTSRMIGQSLLIVVRTEDLDTGAESITLRWSDGGSWTERTVPRKVVSDARAILALADSGLAVNSTNASDVVAYIAHLLDLYQFKVPKIAMASTLGHKTVDGGVFVFGDTTYGSETQVALSSAVDSHLLAALGPDKSASDADRAEQLDRWKAMAKELEAHPAAAFTVAATFLGPIMVDIPDLSQNPIIDLWGRSTSGKTTTLRLAASAWGRPTEQRGLIRPWGDTNFAFERHAGVCMDLPIFMDESTKAVSMKDRELMAEVLYRYANGSGRARGTKEGGLAPTAQFRGVMISTGEDPIVDKSTRDGLTARVCSFGPPIFPLGSGAMVTRLAEVATQNYGVAGPEYLRIYMNRRDHYAPLAKIFYDAALKRLTAKSYDDFARRLASCVAGVEAAARMVDSILSIGWDVGEIIDAAFGLMTKVRRADSATASLEALGGWASAHRGAFECPDTLDTRTDTNGNTHVPNACAPEIWGRIFVTREEIERKGKAPYVWRREQWAFTAGCVREVLLRGEFSPTAMMQAWDDAGWIVKDQKGDGKNRQTIVVRMRKTPTRMILLTNAGMLVAFGDNGEAKAQAEVDAMIAQDAADRQQQESEEADRQRRAEARREADAAHGDAYREMVQAVGG